MEKSNQDRARFDARLSREQKLYFERAAVLGGYRNLTDFVLATVQDKAREIIEENEKIIASKRDGEIFYDAMVNPDNPNNDLVAAARDYEAIFSK